MAFAGFPDPYTHPTVLFLVPPPQLAEQGLNGPTDQCGDLQGVEAHSCASLAPARQEWNVAVSLGLFMKLTSTAPMCSKWKHSQDFGA